MTTLPDTRSVKSTGSPSKGDSETGMDLEQVTVVIKVAERCNLDCTYCYVYHGGDDSYLNHPKFVAASNVKDLASFISEGASSVGVENANVIFLGGEPLLVGKARFEDMCRVLRRDTADIPNFRLLMTTNGTLIDADWIRIFEEFDLRVAISIDGPPEYHDKWRVDHASRGSYSDTIRGLRLIQESSDAGRMHPPSTLTTINTDTDPVNIYRHMVDDLNVRILDFLLPVACHDSLDQPDGAAFGPWLCSMFDQWTFDDDPEISIRIIQSLLSVLIGHNGNNFFGAVSRRPAQSVVSAESDGYIGVDDDFRVTGFWKTLPKVNLRDESLKDLFSSDPYREMNKAARTLPYGCMNCEWRNICGGGLLLHRYSEDRGFDNPSILCDGLKQYYAHVVRYLRESGISDESLAVASF